MSILKLILKWIQRIIISLFAIIVLVIIGILGSYYFWNSQHTKSLERQSEIFTTSRGDVETVVMGQGVPELIIHGTPGGFDQSLLGPRLRPEVYEGLKVIAVSRPGYLRTPLSSGETPSEQADLYAELLNALEIDKVLIYASSGGAPSGVQFALRHPERVHGLVLVVPLLKALSGDAPTAPPSSVAMLFQDVMAWLLGEQLISSMIPGINLEDPTQKKTALELINSSLPASERIAGKINDQREFRALDINSWPLEDIEIPTLIIHGDADENAPYGGSLLASERIGNSKLITIPGGDHFIVVTRASEIGGYVNEFIKTLNLTE